MQYEDEIRLKKLFYSLCRGWRILLAFALAFALVGVVPAFLRTPPDPAPPENTAEKEAQDLTIRKKFIEMNPVAGSLEEKRNQLTLENYQLRRQLESDPYLNLKEESGRQITLTLKVELQDTKKLSPEAAERAVSDLSGGYYLAFNRRSLAEYMALESTAPYQPDEFARFFESRLDSDNRLQLLVSAPSAEILSDFIKVTKRYFMAEIFPKFAVAQAHQLSFSESEATKIDEKKIRTIREGILQRSLLNERTIASYSDDIDRLFSEDPQMAAEKKASASASVGRPAASLSWKKSMLLGFFLGLILGSFTILVKDRRRIAGLKLPEIARSENLLYAGSLNIPITDRGKRPGKTLDRLIDRIFAMNFQEDAYERKLLYAAELLRGLGESAMQSAQPAGGEIFRLMVPAVAGRQEKEAVLRQLNEWLREKDACVELTGGRSIENQAEALKELAEADALFLLWGEDEKGDAISRQLNLARNYRKAVWAILELQPQVRSV